MVSGRKKTSKSKARRRKQKKEENKQPVNWLKLGAFGILTSLLLAVAVFFPVLREEVKYLFVSNTEAGAQVGFLEIPEEKIYKNVVEPVDQGYSIVVPKIGANSKIIQDVDPYDSHEYQLALTKGVAHAAGTATPDMPGNVFLFAHSSDNFYNANRYNSVFYLLYKMDTGDEFYLVKDGVIYKYATRERKVVEADAIEYLESDTDDQQATLMTCWPPGTTMKRLVVIGDLVEVKK